MFECLDITEGVQKVAGALGGVDFIALTILAGSLTTEISYCFLTIGLETSTSLFMVSSFEQQKGNFSYGTESMGFLTLSSL